jgi:uncharacterized protein YajQ (UPF0234 family)
MADTYSFDIVSEIDLMEVDNAINQATKEVQQRYDLKGSKSIIELNKKDKKINVESDDDFKLKAVNDILQNKLIKRGISIKALKYGTIEKGSGMGTAKQEISLQAGIDKENAKKLTKMIKDSKLKVNASIQDEQVRVQGKSKDDLQSVIKILNGADLEFAFQVTNYR